MNLSAVKRLIPRGIKQAGRNAIKAVKYRWRKQAIKRPIRNNEPIKIIVGAAETYQPGWYSTNEQWLDIVKQTDWDKVFKGKRLVTHVVAEHVFEHLTHAEARQALANIAACAVPGARVRIAVPDGYHPDPVYQAHVGIAGIGDDAADHKQVLNADVLADLLQEAGFQPKQVEGYDKSGKLIAETYSQADGYIRRSRVNRKTGKPSAWNFFDADTSLIVDGIKV